MERGGALDVQRGEGLTQVLALASPGIRDQLMAAMIANSWSCHGLPNFRTALHTDEHYDVFGVFIACIEFASRSHPSTRHDFASTWYGV